MLQIKSNLIMLSKQLMPQSGLIEKKRAETCQQIIQKYKNKSTSTITEVDRVTDLTKKEFNKKYLNKGIPVIFEKKAYNWTACKKWGLDYLKENFPDEKLRMFDSKGLVEKEYTQLKDHEDAKHVREFSSEDFVNEIRQGKSHYLRGCPVVENQESLQDDLDQDWLSNMKSSFLGVSLQSFIGPENRYTPIHNESSSFFFIQVTGRKHWNLFRPKDFMLLNPEPAKKGYNYSNVDLRKIDHQKYPGVHLLPRYSCTLEKGDILFVPAWMWHDVVTLEESWGVSYRFLSIRSFLQSKLFATIRLFFAKPSIFKTLYYSYFKTNMSEREDAILLPKLFLGNKRKENKNEKT